MITLSGAVKRWTGDGSKTAFPHSLKCAGLSCDAGNFEIRVDNEVITSGATLTDVALVFSSAPADETVIELWRTAELEPYEKERFPVSYGASTETRDDIGRVLDNWANKRGGTFWYFGMVFELAPQETVDALTQLVAAGPTTEYPMVLLWDDGREYEVVFADKAGEDKCKFDESFMDLDSGERLFKGVVALLDINKIEN
jgi:hypothetical protein